MAPFLGTTVQAVEWVEKSRVLTDFQGKPVGVKDAAAFLDLKNGQYLAALPTDMETLSWSVTITTDKGRKRKAKSRLGTPLRAKFLAFFSWFGSASEKLCRQFKRYRFSPFVLVVAVLSGCGDSSTWHQKLTIEVQTPEGPKSASSVMKANLTDTDSPFTVPEARGAVLRIKGEPFFLEIYHGRYVLVLLKNIPSAYGLLLPNEVPVVAAAELESVTTTLSADIPRGEYPLMITLSDISDPKTMQQVRPEDFGKIFGKGYKLKSIKLAVTREDLTTGHLKNILSWMREDGIDESRNGGNDVLRYSNGSQRGYGTLSLSDFTGSN